MAIEFRGGNISIGSTALYPFTSFMFTSARVSGSVGPSGSVLLATYTGSSSGSYFSNPTFFTTGSYQGYQIWTVPQTATYEIEVAGARGGTSTAYSSSLKWGNGAVIRARVPLTQGQKVMMVVGQYSDGNGANASSWATYHGFGGGGGSFVTISGSIPTPLLVAGGGGGSGHYSSYAGGAYFTGSNGKTTTSGGASIGGGAPGGTGSLGGRSHINTASLVSTNGYDGGGGGGFLGNGYNGDGTITKPYSGTLFGIGGYSFVSGAVGGNTGTNYITYAGSSGGFGGGGGGNGIICGGGGGGYSGGGGSYAGAGPASDAGGGGGSYIVSTATSVATSDGNYDGSSTFSGSAVTNLNSYNSGSGYIRITKL